MITLTVGQIMQREFIEACGKLMNKEGLPQKVAYHIMRVVKLIDQELRTANEGWDKIFKKYTVLVKEEGKPDSYEVPEDKREEFIKVRNEYHAVEVTINKHKIRLCDLEAAKLSPQDFLCLEPLLTEDFEVIQGGITAANQQETMAPQ